MTKKSIVIILIISLFTTYIISIIEAIISHSFFSGESGFPFKFSNTTMFGSGSTNYGMLLIDIIFWFIVIFGIWKALKKIVSKK